MPQPKEICTTSPLSTSSAAVGRNGSCLGAKFGEARWPETRASLCPSYGDDDIDADDGDEAEEDDAEDNNDGSDDADDEHTDDGGTAEDDYIVDDNDHDEEDDADTDNTADDDADEHEGDADGDRRRRQTTGD